MNKRCVISVTRSQWRVQRADWNIIVGGDDEITTLRITETIQINDTRGGFETRSCLQLHSQTHDIAVIYTHVVWGDCRAGASHLIIYLK